MDAKIKTIPTSPEQLTGSGNAVCAECGHRIKSIAEQLHVGGCTFICDQCYRHLSFPEHVIRCPE